MMLGPIEELVDQLDEVKRGKLPEKAMEFAVSGTLVLYKENGMNNKLYIIPGIF
jgi:hypothetical protein